MRISKIEKFMYCQKLPLYVLLNWLVKLFTLFQTSAQCLQIFQTSSQISIFLCYLINNNNRTDQRHKPDISFIKDGKQQSLIQAYPGTREILRSNGNCQRLAYYLHPNYISYSRLYQFGLLYRNCKFTLMIISFRYRIISRTSTSRYRSHGYTSKLECNVQLQRTNRLCILGKDQKSTRSTQQNYSTRQLTQTLEHKIQVQNLRRYLCKDLKCCIAKDPRQDEHLTSLPVQPKYQNTNKSEAVRKYQTLQTQPKKALHAQIKKTLEFLRDQDIKIERKIEIDITEQSIKIKRDVQMLSQIEEQANQIRV
ncbi:Hypothetical_protein [Hexamita inflata]|uniref:Hypothetical_protein n=1 Tax=Hexamita inflata TaxID=28002 RepID=A0AA86UVP7_9EUKA|nr:Hypothetical protein HINF_LOCUS54166 [Hexamita inflata]